MVQSFSLKSRFEVVYVVNGTCFCTLRVCGARSGIFLHELNFFTETFKLFYRSEALKIRFDAAYVVSITRFCALRAPGAREAEFFFMDQFFLPRRFQRGIACPWEGSRSEFYSGRTQTPTHPDRPVEETLRKYIYIDDVY